VRDEVNSLLFDRAMAKATWEVTQVNELLTWLDRHPLPLTAATNRATCPRARPRKSSVRAWQSPKAASGSASREFQRRVESGQGRRREANHHGDGFVLM